MWCDNEIIMIASWTDASPWPILQFCDILCDSKIISLAKDYRFINFSVDEVPFFNVSYLSKEHYF